MSWQTRQILYNFVRINFTILDSHITVCVVPCSRKFMSLTIFPLQLPLILLWCKTLLVPFTLYTTPCLQYFSNSFPSPWGWSHVTMSLCRHISGSPIVRTAIYSENHRLLIIIVTNVNSKLVAVRCSNVKSGTLFPPITRNHYYPKIPEKLTKIISLTSICNTRSSFSKTTNVVFCTTV